MKLTLYLLLLSAPQGNHEWRETHYAAGTAWKYVCVATNTPDAMVGKLDSDSTWYVFIGRKLIAKKVDLNHGKELAEEATRKDQNLCQAPGKK